MTKSHKHIFIPGSPDLPVLLLLHGTGGDEQDLVELGRSVSPGSAILSVRGNVLENGMPRFFRRLAEGVFDLEDLKFRIEELSGFIAAARTEYGFKDAPLVALGYSNGANIAAGLLLSKPGILQGAILMRAMVPFYPDSLPDLSGTEVLLLAGFMDPIIPAENSKTLSNILKDAKATVNFVLKPAGHNLIQSDLNDSRTWLAATKFFKPTP